MWEEFFECNRSKKSIFFISESGIENCPIWIFWTIPYAYIYPSKESCLEMIQKIDNGTVAIDSDRWRLLKEEFR